MQPRKRARVLTIFAVLMVGAVAASFRASSADDGQRETASLARDILNRRGFMYAGAARVVASLWKVDDWATAELMKRFYKKMVVEKYSASAALRAAQIEMWQQEPFRAPYYWAAFTIQGEPK